MENPSNEKTTLDVNDLKKLQATVEDLFILYLDSEAADDLQDRQSKLNTVLWFRKF